MLIVIGIGLAVLGAVQVGASGGNPADQRAFMAQGSFMGLALIIAGAALFVRYSLARFMRFWLIRLTFESRANTDRVVDAIERAAGLPSHPRPRRRRTSAPHRRRTADEHRPAAAVADDRSDGFARLRSTP